MADSFNKKDREKKRLKKKKEKAERLAARRAEGIKPEEFMYVDENGNLTPTPPDPAKKIQINAADINVSIPKKDDLPEEDPIRNGTVKFFNKEKGYGFIIDVITNESYFVHADNIDGVITDNDKVIFEIGNGPKGPIAMNVKLGTYTPKPKATDAPKTTEPSTEAPKTTEPPKS